MIVDYVIAYNDRNYADDDAEIIYEAAQEDFDKF